MTTRTRMALIPVLMIMLMTSNAVMALQQCRVSSSSSASSAYYSSVMVLNYKKESVEHEEHHPHLKQGENIFESTINRVLKEDMDCPLLKHRDLMSSSTSSTSSPAETRTVIVPSTIDSLPSDLVDMNTFKSEMKVQARMRVPSFNAQGYKSSLISDLKHHKIDGASSHQHNEKKRRIMSNHPIESRYYWWKTLRTQFTKAYRIMATKSRLVASQLPKVDWSPLLQWVVLIGVLHLMFYHDIQPSTLGFRLL